ncbi:hypothetical protein OEA41_006318 [Lepraria neglecta]|uniref:Uncharacterized protein n=1 Tax=Lepraria neglecta TaxID=209136 RepID=A0AAE0DKT9_9LECA|nr:hypothetical protein OEA41_006318 [Lepraria neglecta]
MVLSLAYRTHPGNNLRGGNTDGPAILQFKSLLVRLLLSSTVSEYQSTNDEGCQRIWLLDKSRRRVGTAWHVPLLDELDEKVKMILLSKTRPKSEEDDSWQFDSRVGAKYAAGSSYDRRSTVTTHLVARGVAALLLNSVASSAGFGLTQSPDSLLAQYASSNISNSTFATDVLSLLNYPNTTAQLAPSLNTTIPNISINNATLNDMLITCQGYSVLQLSCLDALNTFDAQLPRLLTVGQRVPGKRDFDLNLPVRWISGTLQNPQHLLHQHAY